MNNVFSPNSIQENREKKEKKTFSFKNNKNERDMNLTRNAENAKKNKTRIK